MNMNWPLIHVAALLNLTKVRDAKQKMPDAKKRVLGFYFYNYPKEPQVIHGVESPGGENLLAMVNILLKATYSQGAPFVMIQAA